MTSERFYSNNNQAHTTQHVLWGAIGGNHHVTQLPFEAYEEYHVTSNVTVKEDHALTERQLHAVRRDNTLRQQASPTLNSLITSTR